MKRDRLKITFIIGTAIVIFVVFKYGFSGETNPYTNEKQQISITHEEEIAIGLRALPTIISQYGGLHPDAQLQAKVNEVGSRLVNSSNVKESNYKFDFHLLADPKTIHAFALPGGQIIITYALLSLLENEDQLAGILSHEIGHVVARHSAARFDKQGHTEDILNGIVLVNKTNTAQRTAMIDSIINIKYKRKDELQSDDLAVRFMIDAGYIPEEMIGLMGILKAAVGSSRATEFQSTHPDSENRIESIKATIVKYKKNS